MAEGSFFGADIERSSEGNAVVKVSGELDLATGPELEQLLRRARDGNANLVLDLSELEFIDSTGVHIVLSAFEASQRAGTEFAIAGAHGEVLRVFELVGLVDRIPFR